MARLWRRGGARFVGAYRYRLWREFHQGSRTLVFVMLNPSRASATHDDPTVRRCVGFAADWGYAKLEVVNLFAYRATHVRDLRAAVDPEGPRNAATLRRALARADCLVVAWGVHGGLRDQQRRWARAMLARGALCLGHTRDGAPRHPLYVRRDARLRPWCPPSVELQGRRL